MIIDSRGMYSKCKTCGRKIPMCQEYCREHETENPLIKLQNVNYKINLI